MDLVCGLRHGILYTVKEKPLDPRWSQRDIQVYLGQCATGQSLGLSSEAASLAAEAFVFRLRLQPESLICPSETT
jgi:hypothetical protein